MRQELAVILVVFGLAGCGDPAGPREVPVSGRESVRPATPPSDSNVVTKEARAIATH